VEALEFLDFCGGLAYSAFMCASDLHGSEIDMSGVQAEYTPAEELESRAKRLQALMREAGVDGLMATQNADVFYLTGTIQQAQVYVPVEGKPVFMVRKHYGRALSVSRLGKDSVSTVRSLRELPSIIESAGGKRPARIGFELDTLPVALFNSYGKALAPLEAELVDGSQLFKRVRSLKSDYELDQIRKAARVADVALKAAAQHLREGASELEVAAQVEAASRNAGHSGIMRMRAFGQEMHMGHLLAGRSGAVPSFMNSPTGGYGPGPWAPYGASTNRIKRGEPILLDYTGEWGGYIADQTRMLSIGWLSDFWQEAYSAMCEVETYLASAVKPGVTSGQVYEMALAKATELGYGDYFMGPPEEMSPGQRVPFVGHGVGLELDEYPPLQRGTEFPIEEGMVLAIEPKVIYPDGAIGIEDTYVVTPDGLSPLTISTREIVVV
jgi:Xaa-Pro dipeptidase